MCLPSVQETSSCNWQRGRPLVYKSASPRIWKSTSPVICQKWQKCFIYCLGTSAPPVKATPWPQKKLGSEDVKIDEWWGSNLYAPTNDHFKDSIKSDHTIGLFELRKVFLHIFWATSASWLSSGEICGKKIGNLQATTATALSLEVQKVWTKVKSFTTLLVQPKTSKVLFFQCLKSASPMCQEH